jgi:hypothetical protein
LRNSCQVIEEGVVGVVFFNLDDVTPINVSGISTADWRTGLLEPRILLFVQEFGEFFLELLLIDPMHHDHQSS